MNCIPRAFPGVARWLSCREAQPRTTTPISPSADQAILPVAAAAAQPAADADGLPTPRRYAAMFAVLIAIVLVVLDAAIANLALPTIARSLAVTPGTSIWVVTGYQVAIVMFLLPAGAAGESFGYRRVFTIG